MSSFSGDKRTPLSSYVNGYVMTVLRYCGMWLYTSSLLLSGAMPAHAQGPTFTQHPTMGRIGTLDPMANSSPLSPSAPRRDGCALAAPHLQLGRLRLADLASGGFVRAFDVMLTCPEGTRIKSLKLSGPETARGAIRGYAAQHGTVLMQIRLRDNWQALPKNVVLGNTQPLLHDFTFTRAETLNVPLELKLLPGAQLDLSDRQQLLSIEGSFDGAIQFSLEQ